MREWQSQSHVRWYCKYHVVFVPKYRKRSLYGTLRRNIGGLLRELCRQHGVELVEGHAMPDHIHLCLSIPPKFSVANTVGFLKGKSAIRIHRQFLGQNVVQRSNYPVGVGGEPALGFQHPVDAVRAQAQRSRDRVDLADTRRVRSGGAEVAVADA